MRTLLRKRSDGLFFEGPDRWPTDPTRAHDFKLIDRAPQFINAWGLDEVELVFAFEGRRSVKTVPLEKIGLRYSEF